MLQAALDFGTAPSVPCTWTPPAGYALAQARAAGDEAGERAADRAQRQDSTFRERAEAFVVAYLSQHATASGEEITDAAKRAGIVPPDDRAFGPVYAGLARRNLIAFVGWCVRTKGHGTGGGRLWRLVR